MLVIVSGGTVWGDGGHVCDCVGELRGVKHDYCAGRYMLEIVGVL